MVSEKSGVEELSPVQKASLELLQIVDDICRSNSIVYSITGETLIGIIHFNGFLPSVPNLSIAMLYPDFLRFVDIFNDLYSGSEQYSMLNSENCEQFDVLYCRLIKYSRVKLPAGRETDDKYYSYFIDIYPVFYVGNTMAEYKRAEKNYRYYTRCLNSYDPAPETFRLIFAYEWIINSYYLKRKSLEDFKKISTMLKTGTELSKYAFFPYDKAFPINNKMKGATILSETYTYVVPYDFYGIQTYIPVNAQAWVNGYFTKKELEDLKEIPPNQAVLSGPETVRGVQLVELDMLVELDRICRKHDIKYSLFAGTLLGAVRHKGFIPWDDDIDVVMIYEDSLRFNEVAKQELEHERFFLRTQESDADNNLTFIQIKRNNTLFCKPGRVGSNTHNGVFIDIFQLFNAPYKKFLFKLQAGLARHYRTATWAHLGAASERNPLLKMYYRCIAKPSNKANYKKFLKYATMAKKDHGRLTYLSYGYRSPFNKAFGLKSIFDNLTEYEFEGHSFYAFADHEAYFKYAFHNHYMQLPAIKERVARHLPGHIDLGDLYELE